MFGVNNQQLPGIYELNQKAKSPIITAYISYAIAKSKVEIADRVSFTELFCADGFYAMLASNLGCNESVGIDNDRDNHFRNAEIISNRLNLNNVFFLKSEITSESKYTPTDVVANIGGLYHVTNPKGILQMSYGLAKKILNRTKCCLYCKH